MQLILNIQYFNTGIATDKKIKLYIYDGSLASVLSLLIISGIILLITLLRLRNVLTQDRKKESVSLCMLAIHLTAFVFFIFSQVIFIAVIFVWTNPWKPSKKSERIYVSAYIASNAGTFVSQLLISIILLKLARKKDIKVTKDLQSEYFPTLVVEEYDEQAELQERIWNQFIRDDVILSTHQSSTVSFFHAGSLNY